MNVRSQSSELCHPEGYSENLCFSQKHNVLRIYLCNKRRKELKVIITKTNKQIFDTNTTHI